MTTARFATAPPRRGLVGAAPAPIRTLGVARLALTGSLVRAH